MTPVGSTVTLNLAMTDKSIGGSADRSFAMSARAASIARVNRGKSTLTTASCIGTAKQAPSTILQATLDRGLRTAHISNTAIKTIRRLQVGQVSPVNRHHDHQDGGSVEG